MVEAIGRRNVIVASKNPLKLQATKDGFTRMFPDGDFAFDGRSVGSGVADQPLSDQETLQGALNRARGAQELEPAAAYWVGLEGGVHTADGEVLAFAWIVVLGRDGKAGRARTGSYFLPQETAKLLRDGLELGDADNLLHGKTNSKHQTGTVGILTGDLITRQSIYADTVVLALIPFKNTQLTFGKESEAQQSEAAQPSALDG
ncbi:hypothetical protein V2A60_004958 [Cordyceps javanica]